MALLHGEPVEGPGDGVVDDDAPTACCLVGAVLEEADDVASGGEAEETKEHFVGREGEDVLFSTDFCSAPKTTKHLFL